LRQVWYKGSRKADWEPVSKATRFFLAGNGFLLVGLLLTRLQENLVTASNFEIKALARARFIAVAVGAAFFPLLKVFRYGSHVVEKDHHLDQAVAPHYFMLLGFHIVPPP